ncbi:MAG: 16S rRNA processing protein RimM [Alistipes sp.]|nr:16S rRNA processing protein RimM [Alistipes sp.]
MTVPAGRINKLFGTEGGVMLSLYPAFPDDFTTDTPLLVTIDALQVPLWCERFERRGQSGATAAFADFDTERRAQELLGLEFRIELEEEDGDDEFYLEDLIGFAVEAEEVGEKSGSADAADSGAAGAHASGKLTGTVTDYYDSDANPLFELEIGGRQVLVPAAEEFIAHIDFEGRRMHLVLPEGLIGLE